MVAAALAHLLKETAGSSTNAAMASRASAAAAARCAAAASAASAAAAAASASSLLKCSSCSRWKASISRRHVTPRGVDGVQARSRSAARLSGRPLSSTFSSIVFWRFASASCGRGRVNRSRDVKIWRSAAA